VQPWAQNAGGAVFECGGEGVRVAGAQVSKGAAVAPFWPRLMAGRAREWRCAACAAEGSRGGGAAGEETESLRSSICSSSSPNRTPRLSPAPRYAQISTHLLIETSGGVSAAPDRIAPIN